MMLLVLNRDGRGEVFKVGVVKSYEGTYYISRVVRERKTFFF